MTFLHGCLELTTINRVHSETTETTDTPNYNYYASQIVILHAMLRCAIRNNAAANTAVNFYLATRDLISELVIPRPLKKNVEFINMSPARERERDGNKRSKYREYIL